MSDATPLPSREAAQKIEASRPDDEPNLGVWIEIKVAAKDAVWTEYLSGRLVDRETINYEAADNALLHIVISSLEALDTVFQLESGAARAIVDAALEDDPIKLYKMGAISKDTLRHLLPPP
jgi:LPS sulfotransferase NodH